MKVKYKFVDETVEIEVPEEWGCVLVELERQEHNNHRKEVRRHRSLDALPFEGEYFAVEDTALLSIVEASPEKELQEAIATLEPQQQELLVRVYFKKEKLSHIAKEEGVSKMAITNRMQRILAKLRKKLT